MMFLVLLSLLLKAQSVHMSECSDEFEGAGLSTAFPINVAHRLHSLTLEDLRYYFDPTASENNTIPTVNTNLTKNAPRVLSYTPLFGMDQDFGTQGMRHLDQILRNMDKADFGITNYSILEQVAHVMHMAELWNSAKKYYTALKEQPPSAELCACVSDIESNGVRSELELLALKIKYPGVTSGNPDVQFNKDQIPLPPQKAPYDLNAGRQEHPVKRSLKQTMMRINRPKSRVHALDQFDGAVVADLEPVQVERPIFDGSRLIDESAGKKAYEISYKLALGKEQELMRPRDFQRHLRSFNFEGTEEDVLARAMEELQDGDQGLAKHLDNEEGWESWRQGFKSMDDYGNFEFAMFLYCKLNY